jgi:hypothetical protein
MKQGVPAGAGGIALLAGLSALLLLLPLALAYEDAPPPAMTGGFGEPDCQECHFDHPLNAPEYKLLLEGLPARYEAGKVYTLAVRFDPPPTAGGFELSARIADGPEMGRQAGSFQGGDEGVAVDEHAGNATPAAGSQPIQYGHHTAKSNRPGREGWKVQWTAPDPAVDPIVFHVTANAADGDSSPLGDYIYRKESRLLPAK